MTNLDSDPDLPNLNPDEEQRLSMLLRNAFAPAEIDLTRHERLLQAALEDPFAPASTEELVESERLRRALEGDGDHLDLVLARALSAAYAPSTTSPKAVPQVTPSVARAPKQRAGKLIYYRFGGVVATLAAAAAVLFAVVPRAREAAGPAPDLSTLALAQSRSTAALFQADSAGAPSNRIDRIASARSRELRDNRYALWGVR